MSENTSILPSAVIFDWDGVVINSAEAHESSWERLADETNFRLPEGHFKKGFGKRNENILREMAWADDPAEINKLSRRKEELYREIIIENGIELLPGVRDFIERLEVAGISRGIGSSTEKLNIETILKITGMKKYFQALVTGDDVENGKPNPEVFLKCAAALNIQPIDCIVVEDA
ncbi:MAG: HAD family hydrolase, partial [Chthoniobacterales bacterium]